MVFSSAQTKSDTASTTPNLGSKSPSATDALASTNIPRTDTKHPNVLNAAKTMLVGIAQQFQVRVTTLTILIVQSSSSLARDVEVTITKYTLNARPTKTRRGNQDSESYRVYSDNPAPIKFGTNHQAVHNHTQVPQQHLAPTNNLSQMIHNQPSIVDQPLQSDLLASILKELQKLNGRFDMIESRVLSLEKDVKATRPPLLNTTSEPYPHLPLFNKSQPSPTSISRWTIPPKLNSYLQNFNPSSRIRRLPHRKEGPHLKRRR